MMRQTQATTFWASSYAERSTFYDITNLTAPSCADSDGSMKCPGLKVSIQDLTRVAWERYYWPRMTAKTISDGKPLESKELCDILFEIFQPDNKNNTGWKITSVGLHYTGQLCINLCNAYNEKRRDDLERREMEEYEQTNHRPDLTSQLPVDEYFLLLKVDKTAHTYTVFEIVPQANDACKYEIYIGHDSLFVSEKSAQHDRMIEFGEIHECDHDVYEFDTYVRAIVSEGYCHS